MRFENRVRCFFNDVTVICIYIYFSPHDTAAISLRLLSHAFMINTRLFGNMDFFNCL